jgi:hypothetical protein
MEELRFACDAMLGRLARWLRLAGFDTWFDPRVADDEVAAISRGEGRWLLTRDRMLASVAGPRAVLVRTTKVADQLTELRGRLPVAADPARWLSRCPRCNGTLLPAARDAVVGLVPPFVATHAETFRLCSACARVYWPGTHVPRIEERLTSFFGGDTGLRGGQNDGER